MSVPQVVFEGGAPQGVIASMQISIVLRIGFSQVGAGAYQQAFGLFQRVWIRFVILCGPVQICQEQRRCPTDRRSLESQHRLMRPATGLAWLRMRSSFLTLQRLQ